MNHAGRGRIKYRMSEPQPGPVIVHPWNLGFPVWDVAAEKAQLRRPPCHWEDWVSPPAYASVSPADKESVSGDMECGRHGGQRYPMLYVAFGHPHSPGVVPLVPQDVRYKMVVAFLCSLCQAGVCTFPSQGLVGDAMTVG